MFRSLLADLPLAPLAIIFGLCWGSFLNVVAYRLLCGTSPLRGRSCCPTCGKTIAWYDLLPVLSWLLLRARCRRCHTPISWLYPFIELLTAGALLGIVLFAPMHYWPWLFIYVSALIVTIRTDISDLTIMRHTTIGLLPLALLGAHTGFLPLSLSESCLGMLVGGGFMALVSTIFWLLTRKIGLGQGDIELSALIGAATGLLGWWGSLIIASVAGSLLGIGLILAAPGTREQKLPFGALLALGSLPLAIFQIPLKSWLYSFVI